MNENIPSDIVAKFQAKYDSIKQQCDWVGEPIEPGIYRTLDGGWQCNYRDWCAIVIRPGETEPHEIHGAIGQRWYREWGAFDISGKRGSLGHPISDEEAYDGDGDPNDRISHFENGDIIWTAKTDATRVVNIKDRARWYKAKHDQLLELLREAVEAPAPERHNEALRAVDEKCREDQFDVVLLGEFQYGKSTTFDTLCGGREMSPQGSGTTPTSAVPVSVQSLSRDEKEEYGEIRFKSKRELAGELFDTFEEELCKSDSDHPLTAFLVKDDVTQNGNDDKTRRKGIRDRFCDGFDFDNPDHLSVARTALEKDWDFWRQNKACFPSRKLQLMEVETLVVRFYGTPEYQNAIRWTHCRVEEVRNFVRFPPRWNKDKTNGFNFEVTFEKAQFVFVGAAILHLYSSFEETSEYRMTDCPGLDAGEYDTKVTRRALLRADGILFVHKSNRTIGNSTGEELLELVRNTGRSNRAIMALNLFGISRARALRPLIDEDGESQPSIVEDIEKNVRDKGYEFPIVWCHALLAYLAALGERRLKTCKAFTPEERIRLAAKADIRDDNLKVVDDGRSDEKLWLAAVAHTNSVFKASELNCLSKLDFDSVTTVRRASNFDELMKVVAETVLREKAESILVANGSQKALETLRGHEHELHLKEEEAEKTEKQCADEVDAALKDLDEYDKDVEKALADSQFVKSKEDAVQLLARALVDDTLSSQFYDGLSHRIAKTVRNLNKSKAGVSKSGFMQKLRAEVGPMIAEYFGTRSIGIFHEWSNDPKGRWKVFVNNVFELDEEIQQLGSSRFEGKRLFERVPIPALPDTLDVSRIPEQIQGSLGGIEAVAEELREGFFSQLWNVICAIPRMIIDWFFGKSEEKELEDYANSICPKLKEAFRSNQVRRILEGGLVPVFLETHRQILDSLNASRAAYRRKIQVRCDELIELHSASDEELRRIAEENHKLREGTIKPLRERIEVFEQTVKSVETAKG